MEFRERRSFLIFGAVFGAWLGIVYAFTSQAINWIYMPGIPLAPPNDVSLSSYFWQTLLIGAVIGLVTSLPSNRFIGIALGGLISAAGITVLVIMREWQYDTFYSSFLLLFIGFLPMAILFMSLSVVIRLGVDAQQVDPDRPHLWARRIIFPVLLTIAAVLVGTLSLHSKPVQKAFYLVDDMIRQSLQVSSTQALPQPLAEIPGFLENAQPPYTLSWSDRIDTYFGPRPAGFELTQFLIITRFQNDYSIACIFSQNRNVPSCTIY
jgi:hypothetical protein